MDPDINADNAGRWDWDEYKQGLQFVPNVLTDSRKTGPFRPAKKEQKLTTRTPSTHVSKPHRAMQRQRQQARQRQQLKRSTKLLVELRDVIDVALEILEERQFLSLKFFDLANHSRLKEFMNRLVNYFHYFFENYNLSLIHNRYLIDRSTEEKRRILIVHDSMNQTLKCVGESYAALILGYVGADPDEQIIRFHRCPQIDRNIYELLYQLAILVVWITFERKHLDLITLEIGRMFRSNVFNPALRSEMKDENYPTISLQMNMNERAKLVNERLKVTLTKGNINPFAVPQKKKYGKSSDALKYNPSTYREIPLYSENIPSFRGVLNAKSPAVASLLQGKSTTPHIITPSGSAQFLNFFKSTISMDTPQQLDEKTRVGIIGQFMQHYNPIHLTLLVDDKDKQNDEDVPVATVTDLSGQKTEKN
ncbi:hypothetical protein SNEBB_004802 [Seison nebaliae]|nr:hypothetical protein SNEBB_004802 [Seison nebaliae]